MKEPLQIAEEGEDGEKKDTGADSLSLKRRKSSTEDLLRVRSLVLCLALKTSYGYGLLSYVWH